MLEARLAYTALVTVESEIGIFFTEPAFKRIKEEIIFHIQIETFVQTRGIAKIIRYLLI